MTRLPRLLLNKNYHLTFSTRGAKWARQNDFIQSSLTDQHTIIMATSFLRFFNRLSIDFEHEILMDTLFIQTLCMKMELTRELNEVFVERKQIELFTRQIVGPAVDLFPKNEKYLSSLIHSMRREMEIEKFKMALRIKSDLNRYCSRIELVSVGDYFFFKRHLIMGRFKKPANLTDLMDQIEHYFPQKISILRTREEYDDFLFTLRVWFQFNYPPEVWYD